MAVFHNKEQKGRGELPKSLIIACCSKLLIISGYRL